MPINVLVVDDSGFFRRRICEILNEDPRLNVIGEAKDGREAIARVIELEPDVVTMDIEMPVMDGIASVREIMKRKPTAILMFSTLTTEGAQATLDALDAGALDFLPKRLEDISQNREEALRHLRSRVFTIGAKGKAAKRLAQTQGIGAKTDRPIAGASNQKLNTVTAPKQAVGLSPESVAALKDVKLVAIGTSTGGPMALHDVLSKLPADFPVPVILIQHMPGSFTTAFAERLNSMCQIEVREAQDGDLLRPGVALLAPGGRQMVLEKKNNMQAIRIIDSEIKINYKPCIDVTFHSIAAEVDNNDKVLTIIMTGMGSDGREGIRKMKKMGQSMEVWVQDEASSVVYGMPSSVVEAGLSDHVVPLSQLGISLAQGIR